MPKKPTRRELQELLGIVLDYPHVSFKNIHGERFYIYRLGDGVVLLGDETNNLPVPLFSGEFSVWSPDELHKLGQALIELFPEEKL